MAAAVFNCFSIPIKVAFNPPSMSTTFFEVFDWIVDFIFLLDIIITFRTSFINYKGIEVTNLKEIARSYLKGQFMLDFVATIPIDSIIRTIFNTDNHLYEIFGILKLGRILRLNKIIQYLKMEEDIKASMKVFKMIFFLSIYIHLAACMWWLVIMHSVETGGMWIPYMY